MKDSSVISSLGRPSIGHADMGFLTKLFGVADGIREAVRDSYAKRVLLAGPGWWRLWRVSLAVLLACLVGGTAFVYRFNTLGGSLGGFDNDHFLQLMRSDMLLQGEQPLRDFVDTELKGAWPSLGYAVPAWAQEIGGRNLLSEAYLTVGALAVAAALVFLLALEVSRRWPIALLVALLVIASGPKLYNYPKVLTLTLGALALRGVAGNPTTRRLALAAVATAVAVLYRHDYGVYLGVGIVAGLLARDAWAWRTIVRHVGVYAASTAALLLPSAVWIQFYQGIPTYLARAMETSRIEEARTHLSWPVFDGASLFGSLVPFMYYAYWLVLALAALTLVWRTTVATVRATPVERGVGCGLLAMGLMATLFLLRSNLPARFGDAIVPVALLGAWCVGATDILRASASRLLVALPASAVLVSMLGAVWVIGEVTRELDTSGLSDSRDKVVRRVAAVREELRSLPPTTWQGIEIRETFKAARYIAECTRPEDHLLVAGYAPEVSVLARRRFAAGQATVDRSYHTSEFDQRRALERLARQSVPIVLADYENFDETFVTDYPLLWEHVSMRYRRAGIITVDDEPRFIVFTDAARSPSGTDETLGLPCFR